LRCLVIRINDLNQEEFGQIKSVLRHIWEKNFNRNGDYDKAAHWIDELYEECDIGIYGYTKALENLEQQIERIINTAMSPDEIRRLINVLEIKHQESLVKQSHIHVDMENKS